jgi:hypothetical protein
MRLLRLVFPLLPSRLWKETALVLWCLAMVVAGAFAMERILRWRQECARTLIGRGGEFPSSAPDPTVIGLKPADLGPADAKSFARAMQMLPPEIREKLRKKEITLAEVGPLAMNILKQRKMPVGTQAPDFALLRVTDQTTFHLADLWAKKPAVLLFGSFSCNVFCSQFNRLTRLFDNYKDRAQFVFIYISETPHADPLPPPSEPEDSLGRIRRGLRHFKLPFMCLLDRPDAPAQQAYSVFSQGLIIVDQSGRVAFDAGAGLPTGWNLDEAEAFLKRLP